MFMFFLEKPTIEICCDQEDDMYYVGEDVTMKAELKNASNVLCVVWQTETPNGDQALDITQSKYKGTKITTEEARLCIRGCLDKETYFLLAAFSDGTEISSNRIRLNIIKGKLYSFECEFNVPDISLH